MKRFVTEELTMQQDYLWFLACLSLSCTLVVALRSTEERQRYSWIGWSFGGGLLMALAELVRIAQVVRPAEFGPPNLAIDLFHGAVLAVQVWGVCRPDGSRFVGVAVLIGAAGLAALRFPHPWSATVIQAVAATVGVIWRGWREPDPLGRKLACAMIPGFWFSPIGPATIALNNWLAGLWSSAIVVGAPREEGLTALTVGLRRWSTTGPWGIWSSLVFLGIGLYGVWALTHRRWPESERRELRRFMPLIVGWLVVGLVLAAGLGWRTKREFEAAQKLRVNLAAKLLDRAELAEAFGLRFDPQIGPGKSGHIMASVSREFQVAAQPVRRRLSVIQEELPPDSFAFILLERNGLRVAGAVAASVSSRADRVMVLGPEPVPYAGPIESRFLPPYQEIYGLVTQARAPLRFPDGRFFGWLVLEFGLGEWLAGQTQARLQALAIVGLGCGLGLMVLRQRLRNLARDEALRAAEVARRANEAKSQFLARVSHELRTPLQSVLGYCELLEPVLHDQTARSRLIALRQHGQLMSRLVEDLLDLGALQAGRFHLVPRAVQLGELVRQTADSLRTRAEAKGLQFHVTIREPEDAWRMADGERLRQVTLNLISNAIKFTDSGRVDIEFKPEPENTLLLRVTDTGPGVASADRERLFQPFSRLESTAAKPGCGLGLALARALCEDMQGGLVLTRQSPGACFEARIRAPHCSPTGPEGTALKLPSLVGQTILVVDDNTLVRELFQTCLVELGARCEVAVDGPQALRVAAGARFDVVVLDLALPGMSGADVARALVASGRHMRIVGVSAHASAADRAHALAAGMNAFLTKPVDLRVLVNEIVAAQFAPSLSLPLTGLIERLREQFRSEVPGLSATLATACIERDAGVVAAKAHYLKNSADILGLRELAEACRDLEAAAHRQEWQAVENADAACRHHLEAWR